MELSPRSPGDEAGSGREVGDTGDFGRLFDDIIAAGDDDIFEVGAAPDECLLWMFISDKLGGNHENQEVSIAQGFNYEMTRQ